MIFSLSGEKLGDEPHFLRGDGEPPPCKRIRFSYIAMASRLLPSSQKLLLRGDFLAGGKGD